MVLYSVVRGRDCNLPRTFWIISDETRFVNNESNVCFRPGCFFRGFLLKTNLNELIIDQMKELCYALITKNVEFYKIGG